MTFPDRDHPIWKLLQALISLAGLLIVARHGLLHTHPAGADATDAVGVTLALKFAGEIIGFTPRKELAMKFDWKAVARIGATVVNGFVPGAVQIEQNVEAAIAAPTNDEKAAIAVQAALQTLNAEGQIAGKNYATPRVQAVVRRLNDDSVELLNALAEAHAAPQAATTGV